MDYCLLLLIIKVYIVLWLFTFYLVDFCYCCCYRTTPTHVRLFLDVIIIQFSMFLKGLAVFSGICQLFYMMLINWDFSGVITRHSEQVSGGRRQGTIFTILYYVYMSYTINCTIRINYEPNLCW